MPIHGGATKRNPTAQFAVLVVLATLLLALLAPASSASPKEAAGPDWYFSFQTYTNVRGGPDKGSSMTRSFNELVVREKQDFTIAKIDVCSQDEGRIVGDLFGVVHKGVLEVSGELVTVFDSCEDPAAADSDDVVTRTVVESIELPTYTHWDPQARWTEKRDDEYSDVWLRVLKAEPANISGFKATAVEAGFHATASDYEIFASNELATSSNWGRVLNPGKHGKDLTITSVCAGNEVQGIHIARAVASSSGRVSIEEEIILQEGASCRYYEDVKGKGSTANDVPRDVVWPLSFKVHNTADDYPDDSLTAKGSVTSYEMHGSSDHYRPIVR